MFFLALHLAASNLWPTVSPVAPAWGQSPNAPAQRTFTPPALSTANIAAKRLIAAYPDHQLKQDGNELRWPDGTRITIDDGASPKPHAQWLNQPDLKDMYRHVYPTGEAAIAPEFDVDPGRARNKAFFDKIYGDCTKGEVTKRLVEIDWLPKSAPFKLKVSTVNGVDKKLAAISTELDNLGPNYLAYLSPPAGTYNCRPIAGSQRLSAHSYGIAIDIAVRPSHYWQWQKISATHPLKWQNQIPIEIVRIFEKHGFIWGGRWYHFDTMHFEYRPELTARAPTP
ncbi:MAG: M15 family metallopeptidase [Hyphomicrobiaceae bacterium]|nr:M15 family metallopeptidase [Hyphomicrobiaceae bacterium]